MGKMGEDELQYYHTILIHLSTIQAIRGVVMHPDNPKTAEVELSKKIKENIERLLKLRSNELMLQSILMPNAQLQKQNLV